MLLLLLLLLLLPLPWLLTIKVEADAPSPPGNGNGGLGCSDAARREEERRGRDGMVNLFFRSGRLQYSILSGPGGGRCQGFCFCFVLCEACRCDVGAVERHVDSGCS